MLMAAVVLASQGEGAGDGGCLDLLVDRPWLHHLVEELADGGIRLVDVLAGAGADAIQRELGDGERWGVRLRCYRPSAWPGACGALPGVPAHAPVLLADARALVGAGAWGPSPREERAVELYRTTPRAGKRPEWVGWCRAPRRVIERVIPRSSRAEILASLLEVAGDAASVDCDALLADTPEDLLKANLSALGGRAPFVRIHGTASPAGVWRERGVRVHHSARLIAPVYLGERSEIGAGAVVGPNVVLGEGSVVDARSILRDCLIPAAIYVSPGARCEWVVGLRSGEFRYVSGELVHGGLAAALIDLRQLSLLAGLRLELARAFARPLQLLQSITERLTRDDTRHNQDTAASH